MFSKCLKIIKQDLFLINSVIIFCSSLLVGTINYFYQFLMARMLTVPAYGELQSLLAIFTITSVIASTISIVLTKYTAAFKAKGELGKIHLLFSIFTKKTFGFIAIFFLIFILFSKSIANFLNLNSILPLIILGSAILFSFPNSINTGIINGLQKFKQMSSLSIISALLKIIFAVLLIKFGFSINGAVGSITLSSLIAYFISFSFIKFLFKQQKEKIQTKEILRCIFPVLFTLLFTALLYNIDIIMVKHFFSSQTAGEFGALAMLSNIIFFVAGPVVGVMFPMAVNAHNSLNHPAKILKKAIILVLLIGLVIISCYFLFADLIIKILIGSKFLSISKYLGWLGFSMLLYSLINLFSYYFLSISKVTGVFLVGIGVLFQTILISFFHSNLWQIVWIMNGSMCVVLFLFIFYFIKIYYLCPQR